MFTKYTLILLLGLTSCLAGQNSIEYKGISVTTTTADKKSKTFIVKRNRPDICKSVIVNNTMLWSGDFAHKDVPKACKSTFVHTKGKLLPMKLDDDIETYGELEVLSFIEKMQKDKSLLLIDSRTESWFNYRTIPGAINMPFIYFKRSDSYDFHLEYALEHMGVKTDEDGDYDFSSAKTLALFCNGPWCTQSPTMIYALLDIDYPAEKIKWYRGGIQTWLGAGMTSTRE